MQAPGTTIPFKPRRVVVKLHYSMINQFAFLWVKNNRPCNYEVVRSKKESEFVGVRFQVDNNETIDLMEDIKRNLRAEIIDV